MSNTEKKVNNIKVIPFPEIPDAYVVISFVPTKDPRHGNGVVARMSFFVADDREMEGVEWEPESGPITRIHGVSDPENLDKGPAMPHWYFKYYTGNADWSQLTVNREGLPELLLEGRYEMLFAKIKNWIERKSYASDSEEK
jgi:hypothetical protein